MLHYEKNRYSISRYKHFLDLLEFSKNGTEENDRFRKTKLNTKEKYWF